MCDTAHPFIAWIAIGTLIVVPVALVFARALVWRARAGKAEARLEAALIGESANRTMRDNARQSVDNATARLDQISKLANWRSP